MKPLAVTCLGDLPGKCGADADHRGSVTEESSRNGAGCGRSARRQASDREVSALLALLAVGPETIDN